MARLNVSRIGAVMTDTFAVRTSLGPSVTTPHVQHGVGLFIGLDSAVSLTDGAGRVVKGRAIVIPPDQVFSTACVGPAIGILYDPEKLPAVAAFSRQHGGAFALERAQSTRLLEALAAQRQDVTSPGVLYGLAEEAAHSLRCAGTPPPLDRRIARVLEALYNPTLPADEVARAKSGISPAHLQALFVRDVGVPMRTFRLWRRLVMAVSAMADGDTTRAAHAAGFADLAHFSRTCRRMLGHSPSRLRSGLLTRPVPVDPLR